MGAGKGTGRRKVRGEQVFLSPVQRISRVAAEERVCAILLEDGPCGLPASPDLFRKSPLTLVLAEILEHYGARGTFCVVGDTSENYPDRQGKVGSPKWNGAKWDHWPEYGLDNRGGVVHCPALVDRLIAGGHELASHGYAHRTFGSRGVAELDDVLHDLRRLHGCLANGWGYPLRFATPPGGGDSIRGGLTSYDAFAVMGYQYLSASCDGGGSLSLGSYQSEVSAMWRPMEAMLLEDPDCFCGQIISVRDGRNSAKRTPVAEGLIRQLRLLTDHGYRVVTASELLRLAPFRDIPLRDPAATAAGQLVSRGFCPLYRDNTLRPDAPLLRGELAMMAFGRESVIRHIRMAERGRAPFRDMGPRSPYGAAAQMAVEAGAMAAKNGRFLPLAPVTPEELQQLLNNRLGGGAVLDKKDGLTHRDLLLAAAELL